MHKDQYMIKITLSISLDLSAYIRISTRGRHRRQVQTVSHYSACYIVN